jgi:CubicO group peptidase (beta-lactamase class C family)
VALSLGTPEAVGFSPERLARIRPAMQSYVDRGVFAGISTMLARKGQVVHFDQVGYQDRDSKAPLTAETIFRIYSMTKPISCVALMMLHEEGRFQLFDPVAKYLPAFGALKVGEQQEDLARPMLMVDLFRHTSGLTYNFLEDSPVAEQYRAANLMSDPTRTLEQTIAELARIPLAFQPGSRWHYSMSIDVIAHLVEVISGRPLQEFMQERIFAPLGMVDTGFTVPGSQRKRIATVYGHPDITTNTFSRFIEAWMGGYNERIDSVEQTNPADNTTTFARGGHGLFSTASDYMRFAQMLLNGGTLDGVRILGRKTTELMHTNHMPASLLPYSLAGLPSLGYGFGLGSRVLLNVAESMVPGSVGEFGWAGAAKTYFWVDPKEELVGVLMSQFMVAFEQPDKDFQVLAYQALVD